MYLLTPCKRTTHVDVGAAVREAVSADVGERLANSEKCAAACRALSNLRREANQTTIVTQYDLESRLAYLRAVSFVLASPNVPSLRRSAHPPTLTWTNGFLSSEVTSTSDLQLDQYAMRWNVAAGVCEFGIAQMRGAISSADKAAALKAASHAFQRAAAVFAVLSELRPLIVNEDSSLTPDITHSAFVALRNVMLGNAQMASYRFSSEMGSFNDMICARVAAGVRDYFTVAAEYAKSPELRDTSIHRRVGCPATVLANIYDAESQLRAEKGTPDVEMDVRLTRMREATSAIERARAALMELDQKDPFTVALTDEVRRRSDAIAERSTECRQENSSIYLMYERQSVPEILGHSLVRDPLSFSDEAEKAAPAVLALESLQPTALSGAAKQYGSLVEATVASQKRELESASASLRDEVDRAGATLEAEEKTAAALSARPPAPAAARPPTVGAVRDEDALAIVRAAVEQGGIGRLRDLRDQVRGLSAASVSGMEEIAAILAREAADDIDVSREASQNGIPHHASLVLTKPHHDKLAKIRSGVRQANSADAFIDKQMAEHAVGLSALQGVDVSGAGPGTAGLAARRREDDVRAAAAARNRQLEELRMHISAARELLQYEGSLTHDLETAAADDDAEAATARVSGGGGADGTAEVRDLVGAKYGALVSRVSTFSGQASSIREHLRGGAAAAKAALDVPPKEDEADSMAIVWTHYSAAKKFGELHNYLREGAKFYAGESDAIKALRKSCDDYCASRQLEAKEVSATAAARKYQQQQQQQQQPQLQQQEQEQPLPPPPPFSHNQSYPHEPPRQQWKHDLLFQSPAPPSQTPHEGHYGGAPPPPGSGTHPSQYTAYYDGGPPTAPAGQHDPSAHKHPFDRQLPPSLGPPGPPGGAQSGFNIFLRNGQYPPPPASTPGLPGPPPPHSGGGSIWSRR
jgi:hypothetical protein